MWRLFVLLQTIGACALARPQPFEADGAVARLFQGGEWVKTNATSHCYRKGDILRMEELREFGETADEVVKVVGGTVPDVIEVEQRLRYLRRGWPDRIARSDTQSCRATPARSEPSPAGAPRSLYWRTKTGSGHRSGSTAGAGRAPFWCANSWPERP